jgi:hypothetical protein
LIINEGRSRKIVATKTTTWDEKKGSFLELFV